MLTRESIDIIDELPGNEEAMISIAKSTIHELCSDWREHERHLGIVASSYEIAENERRQLNDRILSLVKERNQVRDIALNLVAIIRGLSATATKDSVGLDAALVAANEVAVKLTRK